jgi:hypothetical protein
VSELMLLQQDSDQYLDLGFGVLGLQELCQVDYH